MKAHVPALVRYILVVLDIFIDSVFLTKGMNNSLNCSLRKKDSHSHGAVTRRKGH